MDVLNPTISPPRLRCVIPLIVALLVIIIVKVCLTRPGYTLFNIDMPDYVELYTIFEALNSKNSTRISLMPVPTNPNNFALIHGNTQLCRTQKHDPVKANQFMLLLVKTIYSRTEQREAIRATYANPKCLRAYGVVIRTVFLLGQQATVDIEIQKALIREQQVYGDLVQYDFVDDYANNTYKVMTGLKFAAEVCPQAKFIVLLDDDFIVHPTNLANHINGITKTQFPFYIAGPVIHATEPHRNIFSKWYVSWTQYPYSLFPRYVSGGTVVMSRPVAQLLAVAMQYTRYLSIDDVHVGIVLLKLGISPIDLPTVLLYETDSIFKHHNFISAHGYHFTPRLRSHWQRLVQLQKNVCPSI